MVFVIGLIIFIYGAVLMGKFHSETQYVNFGIESTGFGIGVFILGFFCLLIAIIGYGAGHYKNALLAGTFFFFSLFCALILLIFGGMMLAATTDKGTMFGKIRQTVCNK
jgi:hypothetical protein